jgi:hypothetical protein
MERNPRKKETSAPVTAAKDRRGSSEVYRSKVHQRQGEIKLDFSTHLFL